MDTVWGLLAVLCLAVVMFGVIIVSMMRRIEELEQNQRSLLNASMQISSDLMSLAESVQKLMRYS